MDIEELLDGLLHKVYGKEVRQGFVDSIRQCYKDATGNPESVAAVVKKNDELSKKIADEETDRKTEIDVERKRIDSIMKGTITTTKFLTLRSAGIRQNNSLDLNFEISSKTNENLKSIKDKSPHIIEVNIFGQEVTGSAANNKSISSSYIETKGSDEYKINVFSDSNGGVSGQYVFYAEVTLAYEEETTDTTNAEMSDARIGADGTVYDSLGEAIREQFKKQNDAPGETTEWMKEVNNALWTTGTGYVGESMSVTTHKGYKIQATKNSNGITSITLAQGDSNDCTVECDVIGNERYSFDAMGYGETISYATVNISGNAVAYTITNESTWTQKHNEITTGSSARKIYINARGNINVNLQHLVEKETKTENYATKENLGDLIVQNISEYKGTNSDTRKKMSFEIGNKIGIELCYVLASGYTGDIAVDGRAEITMTTQKNYKHPPFFFASVSGIAQSGGGYGDVTASISKVSVNTSGTYSFTVFLNNASDVARTPGVYVLCIGLLK